MTDPMRIHPLAAHHGDELVVQVGHVEQLPPEQAVTSRKNESELSLLRSSILQNLTEG